MGIILDLKGKVALVTGASSGIGRGVAQVLVEAGAHVVAVSRRERLLAELVHQAGGSDNVSAVACDLAERSGPRMAVERARELQGKIDLLVNAAGGSRRLAVCEATVSDWNSGMRINYEVPKEMSELVIRGMAAQGGGSIVNITGSSEPVYLNSASPAKAALHVWSKMLSRIVGDRGISVNCIAPGRIDSEQLRLRLHPDAQERVAFAKENIPLGYFGEPRDVGFLVAFLASGWGRYVTGEIIHVDGGMRRYAF